MRHASRSLNKRHNCKAIIPTPTWSLLRSTMERMPIHDTLAPFVLFEQQDRPEAFELVLYDGEMEEVEAVFHEQNAEGHGHGWEGLAQSVVKSQMPEISDHLSFSSEAGTFVVISNELHALQRLGAVLHSAFHNRALLTELIREADPDLLPR
jgi:hypothetical protein